MSLENESGQSSQEIIVNEVLDTFQLPQSHDVDLPEGPLESQIDDTVAIGGHVMSRDDRDALMEKAEEWINGLPHAINVPEYLLERSAAARKRANEAAAQHANEATAATNRKDSLSASPVVSRILAENLFLSGVPECSIAASDAAKLAQERFESKTEGEFVRIADTTMRRVRYAEHAFLQLADEVDHEKSVNVNWITTPTPISAGYPVRLGLAKSAYPNPTDKGAHPDDITLLAELRHGLAFPLVHFSRSSQAYCDYLQFYGEEDLTELEAANMYGWSEDDNGSRFDAVQLVIRQLKGQSTNIKALTDALKLDERITARIGKFNPDVENIIDTMFAPLPTGPTAYYEKEYSNVNTGKYTTNVTVVGKVELMPEDRRMRKLTLRQFPTSQPEGEWPEVVLRADLHGGMAFVDKDNNLSEPTPEDLELIRSLLSSPAEENLAATTILESAIATTKKNDKELFPDTLAFNGTFMTSQILGNLATSHFILDQSLYLGAGKGIVVGGLAIAANKGIKRFKAHRAKRAKTVTQWLDEEDDYSI